MKKAFILLLCIFLLTSCTKSEDYITDYIPYAEIPSDYTLDNAKSDGLVVYENSDITSGQSIWDSFIENTQKGNPCMVRLAFYYTLGDPSQYSPEHYEEIKNDYPCLYIQDLSFDGEKYNLHSVEDGTEYNFTYSYLKRFVETPDSRTAIYSESIQYVLVNDNEVTWEQIFHGMVSSQFGAWIDHKTVYTDYIYNEY